MGIPLLGEPIYNIYIYILFGSLSKSTWCDLASKSWWHQICVTQLVDFPPELTVLFREVRSGEPISRRSVFWIFQTCLMNGWTDDICEQTWTNPARIGNDDFKAKLTFFVHPMVPHSSWDINSHRCVPCGRLSGCVQSIKGKVGNSIPVWCFHMASHIMSIWSIRLLHVISIPSLG